MHNRFALMRVCMTSQVQPVHCVTVTMCLCAEGASEAGPSGGAPKLRVRITNAASGSVRLDTRFPLDFLPGLAAFVPQARDCVKACFRIS